MCACHYTQQRQTLPTTLTTRHTSAFIPDTLRSLTRPPSLPRSPPPFLPPPPPPPLISLPPPPAGPPPPRNAPRSAHPPTTHPPAQAAGRRPLRQAGCEAIAYRGPRASGNGHDSLESRPGAVGSASLLARSMAVVAATAAAASTPVANLPPWNPSSLPTACVGSMRASRVRRHQVHWLHH